MENLPDELADLAAWDAAGQRRRERSLFEQSLASSSLAGVCLEAAERGASVAVVLRDGAGVRTGVITLVGADYLGLGEATLIPFSAVSAVRIGTVLAGARAVDDGLSFAAAVAALAESPVDVAVTVDGGEVVTGLLRAAGDGLLLVDTTWVALDAVRVLVLAG